jgi:hypothetical protein
VLNREITHFHGFSTLTRGYGNGQVSERDLLERKDEKFVCFNVDGCECVIWSIKEAFLNSHGLLVRQKEGLEP